MMKPIVIANWKMNTLAHEARRLALRLQSLLVDALLTNRECTIVVCPPFTNISIVEEVLRGSSIKIGAQNCWTEPYGAFTGEISAAMLRAIGCSYVLVGHSERRTIFHEDDDMILTKALRVWEEGMTPVLCVGETLHQRELHQTWSVLQAQLERILSHRNRSMPWICAYEPVWAIGTGIAAEPHHIEHVHAFIRATLDAHDCQHVPILYGGSVNRENAAGILTTRYVDGALVGSASLVAEDFVAIISAGLDAQQTNG